MIKKIIKFEPGDRVSDLVCGLGPGTVIGPLPNIDTLPVYQVRFDGYSYNESDDGHYRNHNGLEPLNPALKMPHVRFELLGPTGERLAGPIQIESERVDLYCNLFGHSPRIAQLELTGVDAVVVICRGLDEKAITDWVPRLLGQTNQHNRLRITPKEPA